jgi:hypothetical protein
LPFESLLVLCDLSSALSQFDKAHSPSDKAGILPIAKLLKRDSIIIRFMPHAQQNDERSAEPAEIEGRLPATAGLHFELVWSKEGQDNLMAGAARRKQRSIPIRRINISRTC